MHGAEIAGRAVRNLARIVPHRGDEIVQRFPGRRLLHRQQRRVSEHARERNELVDLVGRRLALQPVGLGDDGKRGKRRHDGVAIGLGLRHVGMSDAAARAALVLDHNVAAKLLGKVGRKRTSGHVGRAARRKRDHDRDGSARPSALRACGIGRQCAARKGKRDREFQQLPPTHHFRPSRCFLDTAHSRASVRWNAWRSFHGWRARCAPASRAFRCAARRIPRAH